VQHWLARATWKILARTNSSKTRREVVSASKRRHKSNIELSLESQSSDSYYCSTEFSNPVVKGFRHFPLVELKQSFCCSWKLVERLNAYLGGNIFGKFPVARLKMKFGDFWDYHLNLLVELNRSVYCSSKSLERLKSYCRVEFIASHRRAASSETSTLTILFI
jgi:hypothetical protein